MTRHDDVRLLPGQEPEFAVMSLRPGIGRPALDEYASVLMEWDLDETLPDVPASLRQGSDEKSLGRYLRRELRALVGKEKNAPKATIDEIQKKMQDVHEAAKAAAQGQPRGPLQALAYREAVVNAFEGQRRNMLARRRIFDARKKL